MKVTNRVSLAGLPVVGLLLLLLSLTITPTLAAQSAPREAATTELGRWLDGLRQFRPFNLGFGSLTYEYTAIGSSLSRYVEQLVAEAAGSSQHWRFLAASALQHAEAALREQFAGVFSNENADALIGGRYRIEGQIIVVDLELVNLTTGLRLGSTAFQLSATNLPSGVEALPPNLQAAESLGFRLAEAVSSSSSDLALYAAGDRGDGGVYLDGEELVITLVTAEDAYLKVYHTDVNGRIQLIFPNQYHRNNRVRANTLTQIPGPGYPFAFVLGPPFGTEFIQVLASRSQFADIETAFAALGTVESYRTRGLSVQQRQGDFSEVRFSYTVVER